MLLEAHHQAILKIVFSISNESLLKLLILSSCGITRCEKLKTVAYTVGPRLLSSKTWSLFTAISATFFAPIRTSGTPLPGLVLAPQKSKFDIPDNEGPGLVKLS